MPRRVWFLAAGLVLVTTLGAGAFQAQQYTGTYSDKKKNGAYSYREYSFVSSKDGKTKKHLAIYDPGRPGYIYFWNPLTRKFWGRYDIRRRGYSLLPKASRAKYMGSIPERAFPRPGPMPPPEEGHRLRMKPPPR